MKDVIIYSTGMCSYCVQAKQLLESKGVSYSEVRVDLHENKMQEMLAKSNGQRTVPQIFVGDIHVGGFTDLRDLNSSGKLDELLGK